MNFLKRSDDPTKIHAKLTRQQIFDVFIVFSQIRLTFQKMKYRIPSFTKDSWCTVNGDHFRTCSPCRSRPGTPPTPPPSCIAKPCVGVCRRAANDRSCCRCHLGDMIPHVKGAKGTPFRPFICTRYPYPPPKKRKVIYGVNLERCLLDVFLVGFMGWFRCMFKKHVFIEALNMDRRYILLQVHIVVLCNVHTVGPDQLDIHSHMRPPPACTYLYTWHTCIIMYNPDTCAICTCAVPRCRCNQILPPHLFLTTFYPLLPQCPRLKQDLSWEHMGEEELRSASCHHFRCKFWCIGWFVAGSDRLDAPRKILGWDM